MTRSIYTERYQVFTECLIDARKKSGLTQQQVADQLDRPQSFVAKYERGERRLDVVEFLEVADILKVNPVSLIKEVRAAS